ncbi:hypothetical protein PpBr36_02388 [Pyricularia pennisetigena]|uniref:hypothetical protein n=1 Tax=Pyricularia pennisetigena TaxID=1578925 RepID=UPI001154137C|nr:hypothetical protein PpBr36_02388 [Pyricularia pennisetigena]TLS30566.1 hypothetical protein PpBr36_02388 [Pyricularia pennisetigena]
MQSMRTATQVPPSQVAPVPSSSGRLKYAEPRDLPSFPSSGLRKDDAAASAAASLGWANQKPATPVTGQNNQRSTPAASAAAALLAKDSKPVQQWSPAKNDTGSQAAILAAARKQDVSPVSSNPSVNWGNSAANQAFKAKSLKGVELSESRDISRSGSLRAAKDAMGRPRAVSSPGPKYAAQQSTDNRTTNALTAATMAHRRTTMTGVDRENNPAGSPSFMNMNRQMFTSHPPVQSSVDEQKHNDVLHASAVAMAKRMYNNQVHQQQQRDADAAAKLAQNGGESSSLDASAASTPQFTNLQEAAYKLAQERLSKLQEEHDRARRNCHDYYGASASSASYKRFLPKNKLRRRSSSDGDATKGWESSTRQRRATMLATKLPRQQQDLGVVDEEKRQRDREALLSAARRNVRAQLEGIDRKVIAETGMVSPSMKGEWEAKAQALARAKSHPEFMVATTPGGSALGIDRNVNGTRMAPAGKVDIGGGKYMDQSEIDEIAARRVQPFLDEINEKAEKERERLAAIKAEQDAKREAEELERAREREVKELHDKIKGQQKEQEKARKEEIKKEERERKRLEKEAKMEQKRDSKESQGHNHFLSKKATQNDQDDPQDPTDMTSLSAGQKDNPTSTPQPAEDKNEKPNRGRSLHLRLPSMPLSSKPKDKGKEREREPHSASAALPSQLQSPVDESSPTSAKVKNWLKSRFRPRARSSVEQGTFGSSARKGGFIGGAALAAQHQRAASDGSRTSIKEESLREVALAGRDGGGDQGTLARTATGASSTISGQQPRVIGASSVVSLPSTSQSMVSSLSVSSSSTRTGNGDNFVLAKDHFSPTPTAGATGSSPALLSLPPKLRDPTLRASKSGSPVRDSRFLEMMDN